MPDLSDAPVTTAVVGQPAVKSDWNVCYATVDGRKSYPISTGSWRSLFYRLLHRSVFPSYNERLLSRASFNLESDVVTSSVSSWMVWSLLAIASLVNLSPAIGETLTEEKFRQLHEQLQPSEKELWRTIPWRIDLLAAQRDAADGGKPIFIWAMDGHPLGCT